MKNETQKRWGLVLTTAEIWFNRGVDFSNLGKNQEALQAFDKALSIDPNNASVWYNKGIAISKLGLIQDSLDAFNKALSIDPNNANASIWYNKGITLSTLGRSQEAIECFDKALEINPRHVNAWNNKGKEFYHTNNFENAVIAFENALALNPQNADTWYLRGKSLVLLLNFDEGVKSFDNALKIDPNNQDVKKYKNLVLEKSISLIKTSNLIEELLMKSNKVTKKDLPQLTPLERAQAVLKSATNIGDGLTYQGDLSNPKQNNIIKWNFTSLLRSDLKRYQSLQQLLTDDQKEGSIIAKNYFDSGFNYEFLGYHHEAIKVINDGLIFFTSDENAWNNKGVVLGQLGEITEAKVIFNRIISQNPKKIDSILNLCWILNQSEEYDEIQRLCDVVLKIDSNNTIAKKIKLITTINTSIKNNV
ncbi:tetratricopeptide repeat protein [Methanoregula sp.]|uniref:tetratricopeptide repeat protein n=1 Tax=Methanoregula sp. TaxID=2052170 RepID=UPI003BAFD791